MSTYAPRINRLSQLGRFLSLLRLFLWTLWVIYRERRRMIRTHAQSNAIAQPESSALIQVLVAFREAAMKQDVLLIKLGQFLSTRIDLLPEQGIAVLSALQDEVPPVPFAHVVSVIESELGKPVEEVFSVLERKCTAAASLGQVHKAVLASTGETVAVKIQRPQIDQLLRLDLRALRFVIWVMTRLIDPSTGADITKALAYQNPQAHAPSTRWQISDSADVRAMEPFCWGATQGTAGMLPCTMSSNNEDLINHLDRSDLQFLWQCQRSRHFHLLYLILLQMSFSCCRTIYQCGKSKRASPGMCKNQVSGQKTSRFQVIYQLDLSCCVNEFFMPCDQQRLAEAENYVMEQTGTSDMMLIGGCDEWYVIKQDKRLTRGHCRGRKRDGRRSGPV